MPKEKDPVQIFLIILLVAGLFLWAAQNGYIGAFVTKCTNTEPKSLDVISENNTAYNTIITIGGAAYTQTTYKGNIGFGTVEIIDASPLGCSAMSQALLGGGSITRYNTHQIIITPTKEIYWCSANNQLMYKTIAMNDVVNYYAVYESCTTSAQEDIIETERESNDTSSTPSSSTCYKCIGTTLNQNEYSGTCPSDWVSEEPSCETTAVAEPVNEWDPKNWGSEKRSIAFMLLLAGGIGYWFYYRKKKGNPIHMSKDSPFKMWQAWVGAGILFFPILKDYDFFMNPGGPNKELTYYLQQTYPLLNSIPIPLIILAPVVGFLIGWGVTILWRKKK